MNSTVIDATYFEVSEDDFKELTKSMNKYCKEAKKCKKAKAYVAGCVMMSMALEASILSLMYALSDQFIDNVEAMAYLHNDKGNIITMNRLQISRLLNIAYECGWVEKAFKKDVQDEEVRARFDEYVEFIKHMRYVILFQRYTSELGNKKIQKKYLDISLDIYNALSRQLNHAGKKVLEENLVAG